MTKQAHLLIFGDQSEDTTGKVRALLNAKEDPVLVSFLEQSYDVIRSEIARLPLPQREVLPRFYSLADIVTRQREGVLNPAFQTALTCICQLGTFIRQHGKPGVAYPVFREGRYYLLGLCTGALAAAAVSSCKSVTDLLPVAVHAVHVAFRLGLVAVEVSKRIDPTCSASWSRIFPGILPGTVATTLKQFSETRNLPPQSRPWISAVIAKGASISGPPNILKDLCQFGPFAQVRSVEIPVRVPGHAEHLFTDEDVAAILERTPDAPWTSYQSQIPMVSPVSGTLMPTTNFRSLLESCLKDILMIPLRWDNINRELPQLLQLADVSDIKLTPITTATEHAMQQTLRTYSGVANEDRNRPSGGAPARSSVCAFASVQLEYWENEKHRPSVNNTGRADLSKLAIVGFSGRFPDSEDPESFWEVLRQGTDTACHVPTKRWNVDTHVTSDGKKNTGEVPWGCFIPNPGLFDARFFSISPKEAPQVDPAQRLALMTTYEAMENAGIVPGTTPSTKTDRIGVYHGVTSNDYMETNTSQNIDTHFITGGNRAFIPGRINFCFEFCGPSYSVDTACSSSLSAMHLACNALWRGEIDTAVSGGTNMINNPDGHAGLDRGFFLSKTGNCKTFDDGADGYCRGEGVVTTIIKRLEDAIADNDPILAVIVGTYTNHSAESDSITRPHAGAQKILFDKLLNATGTEPHELGYIEMHGTGTQVGDAVEMESVLDVFGPDPSSPKARRKDAPLFLGAAKANIGHGEGVSGVTSVAKILLMYQKGIIPPHAGIRTKINHNYPLNFKERNVHIALEETPWPRSQARSRKALINNFSAAGGNTALLLEDGPERQLDASTDPDAPTSYIVAVSAKSANSLKGNLRSMLAYMEKGPSEPDFSLARLSYTTTARRLHHLHRVTVRAATLDEAKTRLEEAIARGDGLTRTKARPKIVFTFTGQGSQYLGMARQLFQTFIQFRSDILRFDRIAKGQGFPSFRHVYLANEGDEGDFSPQVFQLAICCLQMALARLWISWGISPQAVVGHSLGEYAALNVAGVLSDSDTIYLVGKRAELLQEQCRIATHAMLATKASVVHIQDILGDSTKIQVACINGPEDTVLGGSVDQIKSFKETFAARGIKTTLLEVPYAFHTSQVFSILGDFEAGSRGVAFNKPTIPVMSPLLGSVVKDVGVFGPKYLARHCRETVNIYDALLAGQKEQLINDKAIFLEIGPSPVVSGMVKASLGMSITTLPTLQKNRDMWPNLTAALSMFYTQCIDIRWQEYHKDFRGSHKVLQLPAYNWDLKEYWIPYENDWCILKGAVDPDAPRLLQQGITLPSVECTTIHKLVEESRSGSKATIVVETDMSREDINGIAKGHMVNKIPLTTPSVYAEIGLSLGKYLLARFQPSWTDKIVDVSGLAVEKALIPHGKGPQLLRTSAEVDWDAKTASLKFYSIDQKGRTVVAHGDCNLNFTDRSQREELQKRVPDFLSRMKRLRKGIEIGSSLRMNQAYGYKLISCLASFHPDYRAIDEVILDSSTLEACSKCSFGQVKSQGVFSTHPAYIDVMTQTAGFVMNAKETTDLDSEVYVNHGWKSLQIFEELVPDRSYTTYVQMAQSKTDPSLWEGDTILLDGEKVVGFFKSIELRWISRNVFNVVLDASDASKTKKTPKGRAPVALVAPVAPVAVPNATPKATIAAPAPVPIISPTSVPVKATASPPKALEYRSEPKPKAKSVVETKMDPALNIISEETGLSMSDLTDDSVFADIGVDSLLSMVITSRFREELGLDLDLEFSLFIDLPTVKHLRDFLGAGSEEGGEDENESAHGSDSDLVMVDAPDSPVMVAQEEATPSALKPSPVAAPVAVSSPPEPQPAEDLDLAIEGQLASALEIVAEESGLAVSDLTDDTEFSEIGVDSLLSMVITSRFREELGLDLDLEFSLFIDLPTVKNLRDFLQPRSSGGSSTPDEQESSSLDWDERTGEDKNLSGMASQTSQSDMECENAVDAVFIKPRPSCYCRPSTSVILQGLPTKTARTLFLFPDGGGSSSSYEPIPRLSPSVDTSIIGFNCPYARDPENLLCNIDDLMGSYLSELRARQPQGPYHLGGWSSGGVFAFLATRRLIAEGETVATLLIIDSPVPRIMDKLPTEFYDYCDRLGLFGYSMGGTGSGGGGGGIMEDDDEDGNGGTPPWLIPHFNASVEVLHGCNVPALDCERARMPRTSIVWAGKTVLEGVEPDWLPELPRGRKAKGLHFLVEQRADFGPAGWEEMLPGAEIVTEEVKGANHFSMMQKPYITQIGAWIERGLGDSPVTTK